MARLPRMSLNDKPLTVAIGVLAVVVLGIFAAYKWSNTVPGRPTGVRADAVFLWDPHVGVPGPRRGRWISCWKEAGENYFCKLSEMDGRTECEGEFIPYDQKGAIP